MVFDVENGLAFRNEHGELASVEEIAAEPCLVKLTAGAVLHSYPRCFDKFTPPKVPDVLRAEQQMPWPRLVFELRRGIGVAPDGGASP